MNEPLICEKRSKLGYRALNPELREIRILSVRSKSSMEIECSLELASLLTCPLYKALSYTWGDPADTTDVLLNGCSFPVTRNLETALQHIRSCTETVSFWIDAICIDQEDTQERSGHVQYMKAIYEQAQEIIVWLGPDSNDGGFAIEAINMKHESQITLGSKSGEPIALMPPTAGNRFLKALDLLLDRDWWTRVWVIQEATCPNNTYFMYGRYKTEFTRVTTTVLQILHSRIRQALHLESETPDLVRFQRVTSLHSIRQGRINQNEDLDLLSLLDQSRTRKASGLSNKLYALFGLATNTLGRELNLNYSISVNEAFIRFVDSIIDIQGNLDVLGHCKGPASLESPKSSYLRQLLNPLLS